MTDLSIWCKWYRKMHAMCFYDINTYISMKGKFTKGNYAKVSCLMSTAKRYCTLCSYSTNEF
ncbi:hypothetical protein K450DRAFT_263853 [Umbelopsis ramanniana AG]|uniref:Uncharacterized protein n=1 Tax=Umbelopsis ramanniana AG TaxID=1314678 RepID=A0AAD5E3Q6_UMBRA|nr:uncharacterized protein K450DRAFT_263853 [Umbelopsis ramanniana AG]KAI8574990.1 hypothetical protein K450DRAFT_263853 [Umbelopsis ramanniana AG]